MNHQPVQPLASATLRKVLLGAIVLAGIVAITLLMTTELGRQIREDPKLIHQHTAHFTAHHPAVSIVIFVAAYIFLAMILVPVWWMQVIAAYIWGVWLGASISLFSAAAGACLIHSTGRWLGLESMTTDWESRHPKAQKLIDRFKHNGLVLVLVIRFMKFIPFGISNYLFAMIGIRLWEVFVGTVLGLAPTILLVSAFGLDWIKKLGWW